MISIRVVYLALYIIKMRKLKISLCIYSKFNIKYIKGLLLIKDSKSKFNLIMKKE
jgi:hypothetical protein